MLVHRRFTSCIWLAGTHIYTRMERGTIRVKCRAQDRETMSSLRVRTRTTQSGGESTNHKPQNLPPTLFLRRHHITPRRNDRVHQKIRDITTLNTYHGRGFHSNEANSQESSATNRRKMPHSYGHWSLCSRYRRCCPSWSKLVAWQLHHLWSDAGHSSSPVHGCHIDVSPLLK